MGSQYLFLVANNVNKSLCFPTKNSVWLQTMKRVTCLRMNTHWCFFRVVSVKRTHFIKSLETKFFWKAIWFMLVFASNNAGVAKILHGKSWWRHQMETLSAFMALCEGNPSVTGGFPLQRPVTRSFDVFFYVSQNKQSHTASSRHCFSLLPQCIQNY